MSTTGKRVEGKVALVTGAAQGQGAVEARLLVDEGATVVLADVQDDVGAELAASLGPAASFLHLDVTSEDDWRAVASSIEATHGRLDVLVNNAGILRFASVQRTTPDEFRRVLDVNLTGTFLGIHVLAPLLRKSGGGSIVNISSTGGLVGLPSVAAYSASKFGVTGLTKSAAIDLGPWGIRVNSIHPGSIDTSMIRGEGMTDEMFEPFVARLPIKRLGTSEDVAALVLFLASDDSSYCTASAFVVDGGQTAGDLGLQ